MISYLRPRLYKRRANGLDDDPAPRPRQGRADAPATHPRAAFKRRK
jgi:hypothetical protein